MPQRNLNLILLTFVLSTMCYVAHRRTESALHVSDALNLINDHYVDPVDAEELLTAALAGMTSKLDPHSEFIPSQQFESFQDNISQEFAGIGIFVEQPAEGPPVRVITPLVGSPALQAGMLPGDRIIRVDNQDVSTFGTQAISKKLKGPIGTEVTITVRRGEQEVEMRIKRSTIALESVIGTHRNQADQWVYHVVGDPSIAYIRLTGFGEKTVEELRSVLLELNNDFSALILDLRGNGGGLLDTAIDVADMFLDGGEIVTTKTRGGVVEESFSATKGVLVEPTKPLAILIDEGSASASEIVSACLQDHGRASIVGARSYGKGTVQNIMPLQYGRSALRLTVARFYRPSGVNLHRGQDAGEDDDWGVRPDEGLEVVLDDSVRRELDEWWRQIAYPSLAQRPVDTVTESDVPDSDETDSDETDSDATGPRSANESANESAPETANDGAGGQRPDSTQSIPADPPPTVTPLPRRFVDPQLQRAIDHLHQQIRDSAPSPAAA